MLLEMDPSECMYSEKGTKTDLLSDKKDLKTGSSSDAYRQFQVK